MQLARARARALAVAIAAAASLAGACGEVLPVDEADAAGAEADAADGGADRLTPDGAAADASREADAPADARSDEAAGPPPCLASDFYCADFETPVTEFYGNDDPSCSECSITIDATRAHRGKKSMRVHLAAGTSRIKTRNVPAPSQSFFVRFYVRIDALPPAPLRILTVTTVDGNGYELHARTDGRLGSVSYSPAVTNASGELVVGTKWVCVEWHVERARASVYVDDRAILSLALSRTPAPGDDLKRLGVGTFYYNATVNVPTDVWYDDLVVAPQRIGCAR